MASSRTRTRVNDRGGFLTAYIIGQPYGEINPKFVKDVNNELNERVVLIDRSNRRMVVQYNGSAQHPQFVSGWPNVGPFFGYPHNKVILMTYLGHSRFVLDFQPIPFDANKLPNYHTYKLAHLEPISFEVTLTKYLASGSQLTLNKDFADYIRASRWKKLRLFGPQGDEIKCKIIKRDGEKITTKIGKGWRKFIDLNGFVKNDKLNFKFVDKSHSNLMRVIKV